MWGDRNVFRVYKPFTPMVCPHKTLKQKVCVLVCVCVCVRVCVRVYVVYEDTKLYNDMGMT